MAESAVILSAEQAVETRAKQPNSDPTHRTIPTVRIDLDGHSLIELAGDRFRHSVIIEEFAEIIGKVRVTFLLPSLDFARDLLFAEGRLAKISTGYPKFGLVDRGSFYLDVVDIQTDPLRVELRGFSESSLLARQGEKRRAFGNTDPRYGLSNAQLASRVAAEYKLKEEIEDTQQFYTYITQPGITDYELLRKRAILDGFAFYVENRTLHYHSRKFKDPEVRLAFAATKANTLSLRFRTHGFRRANNVIIRQIDPTTKEIYEVRQDPMDEEALLIAKKRSGKDVRGERDIVKTAPTLFISGVGHARTITEAQTIADGISAVDQFFVECDGESIGLEKFRPNRVVELDGFGQHDGLWYVTRVTHYVMANYRTTFTMARNFTLPLSSVFSGRGSALSDVTSSIPIERTALV